MTYDPNTDDPFANYETGEICEVTIGGSTFVGRVDEISALPIYSGDLSALATEYREYGVWSGVRIEVYCNVPVTVADVTMFEHIVEGLRPGVTDCRYPQGMPWQEWAVEVTAAGQFDGRPMTGVNNGIANYNALRIVETIQCATVSIYKREGAVNDPIVFYIPGGGGDTNGAATYWNWPHRLAAEGHVVVVVDYPRGLFGHMSDPALGANTNYALSYQKAALRLIAAYGGAWKGDTSNISLAGSSFGGASVLAMLEDPTIKALVRRVMVVSGGGLDRRRAGISLRGGLEGYEKICNRHKAAARAVQPQIGTDAEYLREELPPEMWVRLHNGQNIFPWQDNVSITYRSAVAAVEDGILDGLDVCFVVAANEASVIGVTQESDTFPASVKREKLARLLGYPGGATQMMAEAWVPALPDTSLDVWLYSAALYWWPAQQMARAAAARGCRVTMIYDNYKSDGNGNDYTSHVSFMGYLFGGGGIEWKVGMDGDEARVYAADVRHSEAVMRSAKSFFYAGDMGGFSSLIRHSFEHEPFYYLERFEATYEKWNVLGPDSIYGGVGTPSASIVNNWNGAMFAALSAL